ncbi:MAG: hypothetical protein JRI23_30015, partial [Deltaproteobacteria bacterium]|nr:hypothetical protein [Deltaproteobacteria bacterium]MBW2536387.1 hypothetical protein [Deltaproteobacteria bacterium]
MEIPLTELDQALRLALAAWRRAQGALHRAGPAPGTNPLDRWEFLRSPATYGALLQRADDPLAEALATWVHALFVERAAWWATAELAAAWAEPRRGAGLTDGEDAPLEDLRRQLLCSADPSRRQRAARGLVAH